MGHVQLFREREINTISVPVIMLNIQNASSGARNEMITIQVRSTNKTFAEKCFKCVKATTQTVNKLSMRIQRKLNVCITLVPPQHSVFHLLYATYFML